MKYYVGTEMLEISEVRKLMRNPTFSDRYFTEKEKSFISVRDKKATVAAELICAKKACIKAICSMVRPSSYTEIEILRKKSGRPCIRFHGRLETLNQTLRSDLSTSHTSTLVSATAIVSKRGEKKEEQGTENV